jgi:hypothetical protein
VGWWWIPVGVVGVLLLIVIVVLFILWPYLTQQK